ncbi:MAG TPA: alpha/beta hydrolase [Anaerolineaceae bacterium]|jgi:pimeloyl-ACP methyl ester carboxylesterase|nr:alpha/beta hydrolase [Anaerolineaceae bacterium]HNS37030.1 alpha/beta hydrolase [Anaerolineaceae bacterium]HNZ12807.1 alpha/beta hydrolase [Anaerolineaceae bacterium]HOD03475.1 alpha/beta hydrolase [Anaerolineaceae bacterium]HOG78387.1 alpha/beta hydrolase [Anaerolineaceae bacterium]
MSVIVLNGSDMVHYEVLGRGRPLIFLHGWVGSWRYWIPSMQAASISFRTYALDLWGYGDTTKNHRYSLADQSQLLDGFMDYMGIGRVALVGHGLGALVAVYYALTHADIVDRVMAVSYPMDESMVNPRIRTSPPADLAAWLLGKTPLTEPVLTDAPKADGQAIQASMEDYSANGLKDIFKTLGTACLFVNGENDPAVQPPRTEQMAEMSEQTHAVLFEQSGHFPMLDESSQFSRLLMDFLALTSGESPRDLQLKEEWKRRVR